MIEIRGLTHRYGDTVALRNINLAIDAGGVVGLLGPNGAGKTTLVETLEGLIAATEGTVSVLGCDPIRQARALRERLGVQLQDTALPQELTPFETLRLFGSFFDKAVPPARILEHVKLADRARIRNDRLSSGERQRLAIAVALVNDPDLVVLDEPTAGLDAEARREIHRHIAWLKQAGKTVLLTTHYLEEAERLCDRVILLRGGEVIADGPPAGLAATTGTPTLVVVLRGEFDPSPLLRAGATLRQTNGDERHFVTSAPGDVMAPLGALLEQSGAVLIDVYVTRPSLEDLYLRMMSSGTQRGNGGAA